MRLNDFMRKIGSKGGRKTKRKYGSEHFRKLGRKGQAALRRKLDDN